MSVISFVSFFISNSKSAHDIPTASEYTENENCSQVYTHIHMYTFKVLLYFYDFLREIRARLIMTGYVIVNKVNI